MRTIFKWLGPLALVMLAMLLAGCGGKQGWVLRIQDSAGTPVVGAKVCVWAYPLHTKNADKEAVEMGQAWERGEISMRGYLFTSDKEGKVICKGMPTGRIVIDSYSPGKYQPAYDPFGVVIYHHGGRHGWYGRHGGHDDVIIESGYLPSYTPPSYEQHWEKGDWLAVTVTAPGYHPYHFAFRPDLPSGDLGVVQLQAEK